MSDDASTAKTGAWTIEAKLDFLMHVIAVTNEGKTIPWSQINIPGRTTKSLQNAWTKINKDLEAIRANNPETASSATPTPRKRGPNKKKAAADDEDGTPTKATPKKRTAPSPKGSAKKAKKEEVEPKKEESESDDNVKSEEVEN